MSAIRLADHRDRSVDGGVRSGRIVGIWCYPDVEAKVQAQAICQFYSRGRAQDFGRFDRFPGRQTTFPLGDFDALKRRNPGQHIQWQRGARKFWQVYCGQVGR